MRKKMEKVKINWIKIGFIAGLIQILFQLFFNLEQPMSLKKEIGYVIFIIFSCIFFGFFDRFLKKGIYFSLKGITWNTGKEQYLKSWDNVEIIKKIDFKFLKIAEIDFKTSKKCWIVLWWPSSKSLVYLNNKYVPKNHELYRMIDAYSKNN